METWMGFVLLVWLGVVGFFGCLFFLLVLNTHLVFTLKDKIAISYFCCVECIIANLEFM